MDRPFSCVLSLFITMISFRLSQQDVITEQRNELLSPQVEILFSEPD